MKCKTCNREAINTYWELHEKANKNIVEKHNSWNKALNIAWKEYLNEIAKNPYTGSSTKELAEHMMKIGE